MPTPTDDPPTAQRETPADREDRQSFLLKLSDSLRAETSVDVVGNLAVQMLAKKLAADRVYLVTLSADDTVAVTHETQSGNLPPILGSYRGSDFPSAIKEIFERTIVYEDVRTDPQLTELDRLSFAGIGAVGFMAASIRRGSEAMIWAAGAISTTPRTWTRAEIALFEDAIERTWAAIARTQVEAALIESNDRLDLALESAGMGSFIWYVQEDRGEPDARMLALFHQPPNGTLNLREAIATMIHPEDAPRYAAAVAAATRYDGSHGLREDIRVRRPDGGYDWLSITGRVFFDANKQAVRMAGTALDVTERKRTEEALRDNEGGLRLALEAGRMGTYRFDVKTGVETWDDAEYELLGLKRGSEAPTRELFLSIVHPDDLHLVQFTADDERPAGTSLDSEFRIIRPDTGQVRTLSAHAMARFGSDGKPVELIGINQDVTEERQIQMALRSTEERFQRFSEASADVLWIRDATTLQWTYLSPGFDRVYGLTRQDALKDNNYGNWLSFIVPEDRDGARAALERVGHGERVAFEYRIRRPDGEIRWLRNTDFPIRNAQGIVTDIAGVGSDVTFEKTASEHQRFLLAELQHRVRNTLAVIRSITRRTAATTDSKDEFFTHLDGRIAAFARVQGALTRDPARGVDLGLLLADELRVVGAQEGREVTIEGPPVALAAKAAETLGLAIHELATNAIKHGSLASGGAIDVAWTVGESRGTPLSLTWTERGGGRPVEQPRRKGFGTEILERTLAYELGATTQMDFRPSGLVCRIDIPLEQVANTLG